MNIKNLKNYISIVLFVMAIAMTGKLFSQPFEYIGNEGENCQADGLGIGIWSSSPLKSFSRDNKPKKRVNEGVYFGQWKNGKREGHGTHTLNGDTFEGEWHNDNLRYGKATIKKDGITYQYEGYLNDLLPDGTGTLTCNGYTYEGQFSMGKKSGFGRENGAKLALYENDVKKNVNVITDKRIYGMDISHYQPKVEWDKLYVTVDSSYAYNDTVSRQIGVIPISFVFLKATEGKKFVDDCYEKHCDMAERFGIPHGAYHFYNHRMATVKEQIRNFTSHVEVKKGDLPPVLDIEIFGVRTDSLLTWTDAIEKHYGVKPIVYANERIAKLHYDHSRLKENILWHARYGKNVTRTFHIHQYSDKGRVPGINTEIDLDTLSQGLSIENIIFK